MLVLRRKDDQAVILKVGDETIRVVVVRVESRCEGVRIGFQASRQVSIWREEIWDQMAIEHAENNDGDTEVV